MMMVGESNDEERFDLRIFHDNAAGLDDVDDFYDHDDSNDEEFYARKFYGDPEELDNDDDFYDHDHSNDEKLDPRRFLTMMLQYLVLTMVVLISSLVQDFMVSTKIMKKCVITAIIQDNTRELHTISIMIDIRHLKNFLSSLAMDETMIKIL